MGRVLAVDTVVLCAGQESLRSLEKALFSASSRSRGKRFWLDCIFSKPNGILL